MHSAFFSAQMTSLLNYLVISRHPIPFLSPLRLLYRIRSTSIYIYAYGAPHGAAAAVP